MLDSIRNNSRSFGVKLIFGAIILVFLFWGVGNFRGGSVHSVAEVNGEPISIREFSSTFGRIFEAERQRNPELNGSPELQLELKRQVLQQMIINTLWRQEAEKLGLFVSPYELRDAIARMGIFLDEKGKFSKDKYLSILKAQGINVGQFEAEQSRELLMEKLQRYIVMGVSATDAEARNYYDFSMEGRKAQYVLFAADDYLKQAQVSDEAVAAHYAANQDDYRVEALADLTYLPITPAILAKGHTVSDAEAEAYYKANTAAFSTPERYHVRHIFVALPSEGAEGEKGEKATQAEARMADIASRLASGEDFADLAIQFSDEEQSKMKGGDIGWVEKGKIALPGLEEALAALKPGQVSGVVKTPFGMHLLKLEEKEASVQRPFAEVKGEIRDTLAENKAEDSFRDLQRSLEDALAAGTPLEELAAKYKAELKHTGLVPEDKAMEALGLQGDSSKLLQDAIAGMTPAAQKAPAAQSNSTAGSPSAAQNATAQAGAPAATNSTVQAAQGPMVLPVPLTIADGVVLVAVDKAKPSTVRPLGEVRDSIVAELKREAAVLLAQNAASEALPSFTGKALPEAFKGKSKESASFTRVMPAIPSLGESASLAEALMASPDENWLPRVFPTSQGVVIARVSGVEPASAADWEKYKEPFTQQFLQRKSFEVIAAFMQSRLAESKIVETPGVLEQLRLR